MSRPVAPPQVLFRAANAFSSFAVTVVLAMLTLLALAIGSMQDSKAETASDLLHSMKVEDPAVEWGQASVALPQRQDADSRPQVVSRKTAPVLGRVSRSQVPGPTQEWMGVSKVAFPLLVVDLAGGRSAVTPSVMTGRPVGTK